MNKLLFTSALVLAGVAFSVPSNALPVGVGAMAGVREAASEGLVVKAWHSGLPHRRVLGDRVYGGRCPPQGCPLWTQRDITPDPLTGKYRWRGAPPGTAYGWGTYAAPGGGYYYVPPNAGTYYAPHRPRYRSYYGYHGY